MVLSLLMIYIAIFLLSFQWKQRGIIWGFRICRISKKSKIWWNFRKSFLYFFSYPVVGDQKGLFINIFYSNKTRALIFIGVHVHGTITNLPEWRCVRSRRLWWLSANCEHCLYYSECRILEQQMTPTALLTCRRYLDCEYLKEGVLISLSWI